MNYKHKNADSDFQKLSDTVISDFLRWNPTNAVYLGFHEYDGMVPDLSQNSREAELARLKNFYHLLNALDTSSLSRENYFDLRLLRNNVRSTIFQFEDLKTYTTNPMIYAGLIDVNIYIKRNFAPLEERLKSIIKVEKSAPKIFSDARASLEDSLAKPLIETAIQVAKGSADFLESDLIMAIDSVKNDSLISAFNTVNKAAITELRSFAEYLEKEKLPRSNGKFAIGRENFHKMLLYNEDIDLSYEILLEMGLKALQNEQDIFTSLARIIDSHKTPAEVYADISKDHPTASNLIPDIRKNTDSIREFLIKNNIIAVPADAHVTVKETPKFERSLSTASMDIPGPFEKKATEAYYYITPVDSAWTDRQKEDWLSMFNNYSSDFVTIHEAFPGHYIQFVHLNSSSATKIEKIIEDYAFIEGWAHYTEKMMIDEGYGNNGDIVVAAKYNLAQSSESLLRLCRFCVSIKMHCEGMTVEEATKFFMDNWHEGEKPSRQEALRGTFDPGYLYYSLGKMMMFKLRDDYQKQEGDKFSLEKFHNRVLEYGTPPFELLREKMLTNKNEWKELL